MCRKLTYLASFVLVWSLVPASVANAVELVGARAHFHHSSDRRMGYFSIGDCPCYCRIVPRQQYRRSIPQHTSPGSSIMLQLELDIS